MVPQLVPTQAASWRESSALIAGNTVEELFCKAPPSTQFNANALTYGRLRRLYGHGDDEICKSIRGQSDRRRHGIFGDQYYTVADIFGRQRSAAMEKVTTGLLLNQDKVAINSNEILRKVSLSPDYIITQKDDVLQNQLKMEEFSDLSALLLGEIPNVDLTGCTDELNTPVFDNEAFDFAPPPSTKLDENKPGLKVKVEYNSQYYSRGKNLFSDLDLALDNQLQSSSVNKMGNEQSDMYLYQPFAQSITNQETSIDFGHDFLGEMPSLKEASVANNLSINNNNIKDSNSTSASPQDDRYSYISSPAEDQQVDLSVPDHFDQIYNKPPALNLMLDQYKFPIKEEGLSTLNTPDVIDEVVLMGTDFNILKLVNNEDIATINADNDFLQTLTSPSAFSSEPSTPSTTVSQDTPAKRPRKRRMSDDYDDDEDYVPPSFKKRSTISLADIDIENSNSSDDSYYQPSKSKKAKVSKRRGRPPKRGESVSSEGSKDQEVSRYRELRDKNNEASRKSRLKRKEKEKECEKEADELYTKNIRLKAQVEELEKMVTTFRTNLFKILVTK